jgi:hypothetical protein
MRCMTATLVTLGTQGALAAREQKVRGFWMARLLQSPILRAPGAMGSPIALIKGQTARGFTWPGSGQMKSDDALRWRRLLFKSSNPKKKIKTHTPRDGTSAINVCRVRKDRSWRVRFCQ